MTVIKYCAVSNKNWIDLYLQVSLMDHNAHSVYAKNGFYNKEYDISYLPRPLYLPKECFVGEGHVLSMICESGNFNATTEEGEDDIQIEMTNSIEQIQQNIIKKSHLLEKICLAIKNIDFNEKERKDLNCLIEFKDKSFDGFNFIDDIASDNCEILIAQIVRHIFIIHYQRNILSVKNF